MELQYSTNEFIEDVPDIKKKISVFESIRLSDRTSFSDRKTNAGGLDRILEDGLLPALFTITDDENSSPDFTHNRLANLIMGTRPVFFTNHKVIPGEKYTQSFSTHTQNGSNIHFQGNTCSITFDGNPSPVIHRSPERGTSVGFLTENPIVNNTERNAESVRGNSVERNSNEFTRNESLSNVEYYSIMCDIRNMRVLTPQQWGIVRNLSREKLLEIIEVYDLILQNVNYFFE